MHVTRYPLHVVALASVSVRSYCVGVTAPTSRERSGRVRGSPSEGAVSFLSLTEDPVAYPSHRSRLNTVLAVIAGAAEKKTIYGFSVSSL